MQVRVRQEIKFAWDAYKAYAWGHGELRPLSRTPANWYAEPLGLTIVDTLDTLIIAGLEDEAREALDWIVNHLSFSRDMYVSAFEINIRMLGGIISGYLFSGKPRLLDLAVDLGDRLLPAFNSPTDMPYVNVNLGTGQVRGPNSNPADVGTYALEFGMLSHLTGNPVYYETARQALRALYRTRSPTTGLTGSGVNVEDGRVTLPVSQVGGGVDSYYEYLYKAGVLFEDPELLGMYREIMAGVNEYVADEWEGNLWYGYVDTATGSLKVRVFGALACFFGGLLAVSGDLERGAGLTASCWKMWQTWHAAPEAFGYRNMTLIVPGYELRPEFPESLFFLWRLTGDGKYRQWGERVLEDLVRTCRTDAGYTVLRDLRTMEKGDLMPSYFLAETLKYLYLLFDDENRIDLDSYVFNTEAHPFTISSAAIP